MDKVFVIKPDNGFLLGAFSEEIAVQQAEVLEIHVHQGSKKWVFCLKGSKQGNDTLWQGVKDAIQQSNPEAQAIELAWETEEDYMENVVRNFSGPCVISKPEPAKPTPLKRRSPKDLTMQKEIKGTSTPIAALTEEEQGVVIEGEIVLLEKKLVRSGKTLVTFDVYDETDSITCKIFTEKAEELQGFKVGSFVRVRGNIQYQSFDGQLSLLVNQVKEASPKARVTDTASEKRIEFHLHTKMSSMDGALEVGDAIYQASLWGHPAIAITDHGGIQAFPEAYFAGKKHGIKILYGLEGYLAEELKGRSYHIILFAKNPVGLKNLYKLVSTSHLDSFYRRPRILREVLLAHREGLMVGSACEAGEVYQAVLKKNPKMLEIARFYDYLEIQPLGNNEFLIGTEHVASVACLQDINKRIVELGKTLDLPVIATGDVHFLRPEDALYRSILLAGQGYEDAEHQAPLYFRTTEEMLAEFSYLDDPYEVVVKNPQKLAEEIEHLTPVPKGLHPPKIPHAKEMVEELTYTAAIKLYGDPLPPLVAQRVERELTSIVGNGYAPLYWIAHQLVKKSLDDGYLVGSRGSVGSSLVATLCAITEVNPLPPHYVCPSCRYCKFVTDGSFGAGVDLPVLPCPSCGSETKRLGFDIPFEVFMGFHGDKVPDIDLNFSGEYQSTVHRYTEELFGKDHVFKAGTIGTLAEKTAYGFVKKYFEQVGKNPKNAEVNRIVGKITGVRRTTGQHPGGMMVVPSDYEIFDFTPIQHPANDGKNGIVTTHFDYQAIHDSLVKLDILGHDDPTVLRMLEDLTGVKVLDVPLDDKKTMRLFLDQSALGIQDEKIGSGLGTLGVPEFGTRFVRQMLLETKPKTFSDLVRISGLSHGTNVWTQNAQELIKNNVTDLANVIACRDDIMVYLIQKGLNPSDAFAIMENVRKGKGLTEAQEELLRHHSVPSWYINSCQKISYMFPKAHAVAYVTMAFRVAYFKVYYPEAYYAAYFSIRADEFDAHLVLQGEPAILKEMQSIEEKNNEATAKEKNVYTILEIVIEAIRRGVGFLPVNIYESHPHRFRIVDKKLLPPLGSLQGLGVTAASSIADSRSGSEFTSIDDLRVRARLSKTVLDVLRDHGCLLGLPETNQLQLF